MNDERGKHPVCLCLDELFAADVVLVMGDVPVLGLVLRCGVGVYRKCRE